MAMSDLLGAGVSAGTSLLGGIIGGIGANRRQKKAIEAQRKENELARQWNERQARWALEEQRKDVQSERDYNSPSAQMARLKDAGLNPDLMYSNGAGGLVDSQIARAEAAQGVSPTDVATPMMQTPTAMESLLSGAAYAKMIAEANNTKADTAKKQGEIISLDYDNFIKAATQGNTVELSNLSVKIGQNAAEYGKHNISKLLAEIESIDNHVGLLREQMKETVSHTANMDAQTMRTRMETFLSGKRFALEVSDFQRRLRETDAKINLDNAVAKGILVTMYAKVNNLDADTALKGAQLNLTDEQRNNVEHYTNLIDVHRDQATFQLSQDQTYDSAQRVVSIANQATQSLYHLSQIASDWLPSPGNISKLGSKVAKGFGR